jgi:hypothetical protein
MITTMNVGHAIRVGAATAALVFGLATPVARATVGGGEPLTITPTLRGGPYMFPVETDGIVADTYGAARNDVPGDWHHGDDIFAPLGTPVVAAASGTLNRVGWNRVGGWRLWVRDRYGDEFYYAHMSGYSPAALHDKHVHRGEVIGFVGTTGDAFTTPPHIDFEIHPRSLLHLDYAGAVDPTTYIDSWPRPSDLHPPRPVLPRLPHAVEPRHEAVVDFREALHARGLKPLPPRPAIPPIADLLPAVVKVAQHRSSEAFTWAAGDAATATVVLALLMWRRERAALTR